MAVSKTIADVRKKIANSEVIQTLEKFKIEGETFNVRLEEIDILRQVYF
jgi:hypothetical protein